MNEFEVEDDWENFSPILILNLMFHLIFRSTWYARNYNSRYYLPVAYSILKKIYKMPIEENTRAIIEFVKYPISGLGLTSNDLIPEFPVTVLWVVYWTVNLFVFSANILLMS